MTVDRHPPDFVTAFARSWPENQPDIMVLSLTTQRGSRDLRSTRAGPDQSLEPSRKQQQSWRYPKMS